jgi:hypothetical protein
LSSQQAAYCADPHRQGGKETPSRSQQSSSSLLVDSFSSHRSKLCGSPLIRERSPALSSLPANIGPIADQQPLSSDAVRRLSESMPQLNISTSPDILGSASWDRVAMELAGASQVAKSENMQSFGIATRSAGSPQLNRRIMSHKSFAVVSLS